MWLRLTELKKVLEIMLSKWSDQKVVSVSRAHCSCRLLAKDEGEIMFGWLFCLEIPQTGGRNRHNLHDLSNLWIFLAWCVFDGEGLNELDLTSLGCKRHWSTLQTYVDLLLWWARLPSFKGFAPSKNWESLLLSSSFWWSQAYLTEAFLFSVTIQSS